MTDIFVYLLVLLFGGQSFLKLLLCVGVDGRAVCRPHIVPLTHPCTKTDTQKKQTKKINTKIKIWRFQLTRGAVVLSSWQRERHIIWKQQLTTFPKIWLVCLGGTECCFWLIWSSRRASFHHLTVILSACRQPRLVNSKVSNDGNVCGSICDAHAGADIYVPMWLKIFHPPTDSKYHQLYLHLRCWHWHA